jgi:hypothetical protein
VGFFAHFAGPKARVIDWLGLANPLLSRLPPKWNPDWRPGHLNRYVPDGYEDSVRHGDNRLTDPRLHEYYDRLRTVVHGPLWSWDRFTAIWELNTGAIDHLIDEDRYRFPKRQMVAADAIGAPKLADTPWDAPGNLRIVLPGMVEVSLPQRVQSPAIEISVDGGDEYRVTVVDGTTTLHSADVEETTKGGLKIHRIDLPASVVERGFDTIRVMAIDGDGKYSVGHVRVLPQ